MRRSDETGTNGRQLLLIAAFVGNERNVISAVGSSLACRKSESVFDLFIYVPAAQPPFAF